VTHAQASQTDSPDESIAGLFSRLIDDAKGFVRAEIRLYRAELFGRLDTAKMALALGALALLIANATIVAGLVGLVLVLRRYIGSGWSVVAVVGGSLLIAGILGWLALRGFRKATSVGSDPK
jgi:uncharacterized membrane protein YqjE